MHQAVASSQQSLGIEALGIGREPVSVGVDLPMDMGSGRVSGVADFGERLPLPDMGSRGYQHVVGKPSWESALHIAVERERILTASVEERPRPEMGEDMDSPEMIPE
jgi:hypothetical protein